MLKAIDRKDRGNTLGMDFDDDSGLGGVFSTPGVVHIHMPRSSRVKRVRAPKSPKSPAAPHVLSTSSHTSNFAFEAEHPRGESVTVNPDTGKIIHPGQFAPKVHTDDEPKIKVTRVPKEPRAKKEPLPPLPDTGPGSLEDIADACWAISSQCDGARSKDDMGFNGGDAVRWDATYRGVPVENWTLQMYHHAHAMLRKYKVQLRGLGVDYDKLPVPPLDVDAPSREVKPGGGTDGAKVDLNALVKQAGEAGGTWFVNGDGRTFIAHAPSEKATPPDGFIANVQVVSNGMDTLRVRFKYDPSIVDAVKSVPGRRYDGAEKCWIVPIESYGDLARAVPHMITGAALAAVDGYGAKAVEEVKQAEVAQAMLSDEDRNFTSDVLFLSRHEVSQHADFSDWEKQFLGSVLGKSASQISEKQLNIVQRIQGTHDRYLGAHPEQRVALRVSFELRNGERLRSEREKTDRIDAILQAQTSEELTLPADANRSVLIGGDLFPHQKGGVNWLMKVGRGILAFGTGMGKTWTAFTAFEKLREAGQAKRMICVVPKARLVGTSRDIDALYPGRNVVTIVGTKEAREKLWKDAESADYVICGYDLVRTEGSRLKSLRPDVMMFDEAVRLKGKNSQVAKQAREQFNEGRVWYVSATPIPNSPADLFNMMHGINPELFGSMSKFKRDHCDTVYNNYTGGRDIVGYSDLAKTRKVCEPYILHRDYDSPGVDLGMPERMPVKNRIDMGTEQVSVYKRMAKAMLSEAVDGGLAKFNSAMAITNLLRLEQISISPRLLDPDWKGESPKIDEAVNLIKTHFDSGKGQAAIIFSHYLGTQPLLKEAFKESGMVDAEIAEIRGNDCFVGGKRVKGAQDVVDAVNLGSVKVLLASDAAMEGLNLQHKANLLLHMDTPWRPDAIEQREGRIYRPGQKNKCVFVQMLMNNGVEDLKEATVERKAHAQSAIVAGTDMGDVPKLTYADYLKALGGK